MKLKYREYLKSKEWVELKIDLLQLRLCKCEKCKIKLPANKLQIHHKTYERLYNELASDLLILCGSCHKKEHGIKNKTKRKPNKEKILRVKSKKPSLEYLKNHYEFSKKKIHNRFKCGKYDYKTYSSALKGNNTWYKNKLKIHYNIL